MTKDAKSIKVAVLLDKKPGRTVQNSKVKVDYCGFVLKENSFVIGYGLDYNQEYRGLPFIGILKPSAYS